MESIETNKAKRDQETRMVNGEKYWTSAKAARYLGISKVSMLTYARKKLLVSKLDNGFVLFKQENLDEFVNKFSSTGVTTCKK